MNGREIKPRQKKTEKDNSEPAEIESALVEILLHLSLMLMETKKILFLSEYLEMTKSYFKNVTDNITEAGNERLSYHLKLYVDHQKVLMKIHISIYGVVTKKI